jgi:hypothetical protein
MGYNARNDEIRDNVTRMQRDFQLHGDMWFRKEPQVAHHACGSFL